jgi:TrmH family RNA methyltransferase
MTSPSNNYVTLPDCLRIVLVRPLRPGNVGAVCRAMSNLGLRELVLVAPQCRLDDPQAVGYAARARDRLAQARIVPDVPAALEGCVLTFATSAKGGLYRRSAALAPAEAAELAARTASIAGPVAIAFGPEDRGLVLSELLSFDRVIEIPADPDYPALNLAAAVVIVCYELRCAGLRLSGRPLSPPSAGAEPADDARKRAMYERLFQGLERIGFFRGQQYPDHLKFALRHLLGRAELTVNETDILIGMGRQMSWFADHPTTGPRQVSAGHGETEPDAEAGAHRNVDPESDGAREP